MQALKISGFDIPGCVRFEQARGGLARAVIAAPAAEGEIYLQGAHVTHWTPRGMRPVLFLSSRSLFEPGKPIRGGVPVVFPWFGPRGGGLPGPMHGFARIEEWTIANTRLRDDGSVEIEFTLRPGDQSRELGFASFDADFRVAMGSRLEMELEIRNPGPSPLDFEAALHTYFAVGDIQALSVLGLEGTTYIDKTDEFRIKQQGAEPVRFRKETDQVHVNTTSTCTIVDPAWNRHIVIEKSGSNTTVVWNPWIEKARRLDDFGDDEWRTMVCVETANVGENAIRLEPSQSHRMGVAIRVGEAPAARCDAPQV